MRIVIDVPEWAQERQISIFAGVEMLADYHPLKDPDNIYVKDQRCNFCGDCCRGVNLTKSRMLNSIDGQCILLVQRGDTWICTAHTDRPLSCCRDPNPEDEKNCSITYIKVPIER